VLNRLPVFLGKSPCFREKTASDPGFELEAIDGDTFPCDRRTRRLDWTEIDDLTPRPSFVPPKVTVAAQTSLLSFRKARKARIFPVKSGAIWGIPVKRLV
jgi:hypothetical protein